MNYAYTIPLDAETPQGTNVGDYWVLDYSRSTLAELDETELHETLGVGGPAGRFMFYNYAGGSDPDPVKRAITRADRVTINWDGDDVDPDLAPLQRDINRVDENQDPEYDSTLESFTDWDRLWYHLSGTAAFDDLESWPGAKPAAALDQSILDAFRDVEWTDFASLDDAVIFVDGFELGSTTAWSDTVP